LIAAANNIDETTAGVNSDVFDPTNTIILSTKWKVVYTPPAAPYGTWDSPATYVDGPVSYVALCSKCRPSIANGAISTPTQINSKIATNVKPGCTPAKASTSCWHMAASIGLPHQQISGIAVDPSNARTIYVGLRNMIVMGADPKATGYQKVMVSHDGGDHFTDLTGNLPTTDVHRIVLRDGRLYIATDVGVFTAKAGSKAWKQFGTGLPQVAFRSMQLSRNGRYLIAGAYGRGAWVYDFGANAKVPPTVVPKHPTAGGSSGGSIAATGLSYRVPVGALLVLLAAAAAFAIRRRIGEH
jgi:hypothetical protein